MTALLGLGKGFLRCPRLFTPDLLSRQALWYILVKLSIWGNLRQLQSAGNTLFEIPLQANSVSHTYIRAEKSSFDLFETISFQWVPFTCAKNYSCLNATIGSTRIARRAGM
jgi:hypothetical protein